MSFKLISTISSKFQDLVDAFKNSQVYKAMVLAFASLIRLFTLIVNMDFRKVWIGTSILSLLVAILTIFAPSTIAINLEFVIVIILLIQNGHNYDEKYVNTMKSYGVLINFFSLLVVFFAVGYNSLAAEVMIFASFWAIAAYSLNLSTGMVGVLNFGVIAQIIVGAVTYAVLTVNHDVPILLAIFAAMLASALFSGIIAVTTLRLRDDYFAIVSITLGEIFRQIAKTEVSLRGPTINGKYPSTAGVLNIPFPLVKQYRWLIRYFDQQVDYDLAVTFTQRFFLGLIGFSLVIITYYLVTKIVYSPYGRVLKSIREDELVTSTYGKNLLRYKVEVMAISGAFAGLAGVYISWIFVSIFPENFLPTNTFFIWTVFIIGGRGSNKGIFVGAIGFTLLRQMSLS
ncbi:MAG: branched-chain amino acid ABC transporter permease, partial [Candidatus Heimdallarchaeota archaeon]